MKIGALTLFQKMHANGKPCKSVLIAALHWRWSLTWRWHFSWTPELSGSIGPYFMRVYRHSPGFNFHAGLNLPVIGAFSIQTQPNMPLKKKESKSK